VIVWVIVLSIGTLCGLARSVSVSQRRILIVFAGVCGVYAVVAILQVVPGFLSGSGDPIWQRAGDLLERRLPSRISSRAEIPRVAIGHFLLVVTSFASGFFVGTSRRDSDTLSLFARYSVLLYAIYGMLALVLTPSMLLWEPKVAYVGSLTASFVNHNTAATFIGVGVILWLCLALNTLQSVQFGSLRLLLLTPSNEQAAFRLMSRTAAGLTCIFALLLTRSRGGLICSCLGLLVAAGLMIAGRTKARIWYVVGSAAAVVLVMFGWLAQTGRIASEGLFDGGRWTVYGYCLDAIRQRPLLGAGAGTFGDLLPSMREPDFNNWGVWDYAHSTILEIAVEMGVPVAVLIASGAIAALYVLARATLRASGRDRNSFAAATGVAALAYSHSIIDFSLQIPGFLIVFWILMGCWLARSFEEEPKGSGTTTRNFAAMKPTSRTREPISLA
jgi:O-antigen ligase